MVCILWVNKYVIASDIIVSSLIILIIAVSSWFEDIISEATYEGKHSEPVQQGLKLGMILLLFLRSCFFFFYIFSFCVITKHWNWLFWPPLYSSI